MIPYQQLTERGQVRRMRQLAEQVLTQYELKVERVAFLARMTNLLYRVDTAGGRRYVLRIYSDADSTLAENRTEVFWLNAIRRDTNLRVVTPVLRRDGEYISLASMPGLPPERRCVLFNWVPGRPLETRVTAAAYQQFGGMLARLHDHSERLALPTHIHPKRWDKVFYYPGENAIFARPEHAHLFPPERLAMMDEAVSRCGRLLSGLYAQARPPMLIHGDLHPGNIHVERGLLHFLDFEDICLGYPVQDVAISLYYGRSRPDYPELVEAFRKGYASVRAWPVRSSEQLAGLMAARNANFINYVVSLRPNPEQELDGMFTRLAQSLAQMGSEWR